MKYKAELIAWTKGETLQFRECGEPWKDIPSMEDSKHAPGLWNHEEWRIKPREKYVMYNKQTKHYIEIHENGAKQLKNPDYIVYKIIPL